MMIRTTLTDEQIVKLKESIDAIRNVCDILTELAGPCDYSKGEIRPMLMQKFMHDALILQPLMCDLLYSYEGIMNYKKHINRK